MKRKDFLIEGGKIVGILTIGVNMFYLCGCTSNTVMFNRLFSLDEVQLLNELAGIIIPKTDTPGGKEAKTGEFAAFIVQDCYSKDQQNLFKNGIKKINSLCEKAYGKQFLDCSKKQRTQITEQLDQGGNEEFKKIKNLITSGYLSSKIGATQFSDYYPVPGRYDGCTRTRPW